MNQYFVVSITPGGTFDIVVQQSQPIVVSVSSANGASGVTSVGLQTGTSGTDVNVTNSPITSSGDIVLNIPIADATKTGKLSNTDWSTFNGKQNALGYTPEDVANKSTNVVTDQTSDTKYPSVKAVFDFHNQNPYTLQEVTDAGNTTTNTINVDAVAFDLTPTAAPGAGQIAYKANTGALAYLMNSSAVESTIGQTMHAYVHNADSVTITKGQAVYLFAASGNKASVKLANNTSDATSAKTFGLAAENIAPNNNGFVICQGVLDGLNLGTYNAGDTLYLGATAGSYTAVKPYAPNHLVYIGIVERANNGNGQIYVKVQNGYELDEIHDVDLISVAPVSNDVLTYVTGSPNLWKPRSIGTILGYTPVAPTRTISTSSPLSGGGDLTADRTLSIADAAADGTTKGAAAFNANDFDSASGVISIDYTNGQSASASNKGFLTAADWSRFNSTPRIILADTGTYTLATSGVFTIMKAILIPANTFTSGVLFLDYLGTRVSGTAGNISSRVYVGTSPTVLGTQILANLSMNSTLFWARQNRALAYKSATSTLGFNSTTLVSNEFVASTAAATSTNIDWTVDQYIQITLFNSAGDTSAIQWITLIHYP